MRDDMYEGRWSPFDPKWYQEAFDKYISNGDQLFNQELIIQQGYNIPDADRSKSSVFRNDAILNNSFNEQDLRKTLNDIYSNSSLKLIASNHDNTHFYQWAGKMSDVEYIPNTNQCELVIPTDTFINSKDRDKYKLSQYFRKWIKIEDLLNNWDVFKWACLVFINQRIYSEYEFHIDDHEVRIRFTYNDYWVKNDYPIYVYKFDTNFQCRSLITRRLCESEWDWKVPISYFKNDKIANFSSVMVTFNKISDQSIRKDGISNIDILGDNIEFLKIEDGYIDLSEISKFNKILIQSEDTEWIWMSIVVPKFFNEYPILLPVDSIYRPYVADFQAVTTMDYNKSKYVKSTIDGIEDKHQIYVDINNRIEYIQNGWKQMIRPIVLADSFDDPKSEAYDALNPELDNLRDYTINGANLIEEFRFFIKNDYSDEKYDDYLNKLEKSMADIRNAMHEFMDKRQIEYDEEYENKYTNFLNMMKIIREEGYNSEYFHTYQGSEKDFWNEISPLIFIPRNLSDRYYISEVISKMRDKKNVWDDPNTYMNRLRFQRPIDESDFWIFEYDLDNEVWRPYPLSIERKFPDVYILNDPNEKDVSLNRMFKAFFFYSDTINVRNESSEIRRATPSWDDDLIAYHANRSGTYRDIFMEKFYWMGVRSIYKGLLLTQARWEAIEYVIDNNSYNRFNELFINTVDPYFKLGLATYLKSDNFEFPFDDAISKMEEAINGIWLNYKKVTNFEMYLNNNWIPSYFDYISHIGDDYEYEGRLIRRPRNSFDIDKLIPNFKMIQNDTNNQVSKLSSNINWILSKLSIESYNINIDNIKKLYDLGISIKDESNWLMNFIEELDMQILSIDDINKIILSIDKYYSLLTPIDEISHIIFDDASDKNVHESKSAILRNAANKVNDIPVYIRDISLMIQTFDMDKFMKAINDLRSYFTWDKNNPDDKSLIGYINEFNDPWADNVKAARNKLFVSTSKLYGLFEPTKYYLPDEVDDFVSSINDVRKDISDLMISINRFWERFSYKEDPNVTDKLAATDTMLLELVDNINKYSESRKEFTDVIDEIKEILLSMDQYNISNTEIDFRNNINDELYNVLLSLSYIAGKNDKETATKHLDECKKYVLKWTEFILIEKEVFDKIFELTTPPIDIIGSLIGYGDILKAYTLYMDTVNDPYIQDLAWPTYSDVYAIEEIEITNNGFSYKVGDDVFIPSLGSYKVSEVEGNVSKAVLIESLNYINTTYRDPMTQQNPYDSISNGDGMGIIIKPIKSSSHKIINDEPSINIIKRIKSITELIEKDINSPNPYNNTNLKLILSDIDPVINNWNDLKNKFADHMTDDRINDVDLLISYFNDLLEKCLTFIEDRSKINIGNLIGLINEFISNSYKYMEKSNKLDETFFYYDNMIRESSANLSNFYGSGTTWSDTSELKNVLDNTKGSLTVYEHMVIDNQDSSDEIIELNSSYKNIIKEIDFIINAINNLPNDTIIIIPILNNLKISSNSLLVDYYHEIWYKINKVGVAEIGRGYKIGDIVELIPNLLDEFHGDTILFEVTDADDGKVISVKPLLDYATKYLINGIYNTKSRVGSGEKLKINIKGYELSISDSTLLMDDSSSIKKFPLFNENDLFVYKFENIHDLAIEYDVFLGGKQINNFYRRHLSVEDNLHPKNIDLIYVNANSVMDLQNASVYIPENHYFIYRVDGIEVNDPGAGYSVGQKIYVDTGVVNMSLQVNTLDGTPLKGIDSVNLDDTTMIYDGIDPSCKGANVVVDSLNNIDDEYNNGYYNKLTSEGIIKPLTMSYPIEKYAFRSKRFDSLSDGDMNKSFMYSDIDHPNSNTPLNGDPDDHFYLGSRIDNSMHPMEYKNKWSGINNTISPLHPMIEDNQRVPYDKPIKGDYQLLQRLRIHNSNGILNDIPTERYDDSIINSAMKTPDLIVESYADLPKHTLDYPDGAINKRIIVEHDETNDGHRMMYRIRTFVASGFFVYDIPEIADYSWNMFTVDWMNTDSYRDYPSDKAVYPSKIWNESKDHRTVQEAITDGKIDSVFELADVNFTTYIHNLTVDDLSVYNWTTYSWENLNDPELWKLDVINDDENKKYGFTLTYLKSGIFSYDMALYLNKIPDNQKRNESLKRNAKVDVITNIIGEVNTPALNMSINTGRDLRIRKLFPYYQKESFQIGFKKDGTPLGYEMDFKLAPYMHFKNELQLGDINIYNKTAGRFEDVLDPTMFEVRFKDPKSIQRGFETQTKIIKSLIDNPGEGFVDGNVWAYNIEFGIHVFGYVHADIVDGGKITMFTPLHCPNPPKEDIALSFQVYQTDLQTELQMGIVIIQFETKKIEVFGDGYIHNVTNPFAPLPKEFKIIALYDLDGIGEYDIIIDKNPKTVDYRDSHWKTNPVIELPDHHVNNNRLYIMTDNGRFPLVNPSTKRPTFKTEYTDTGTNVTFLNLYRMYEHLQLKALPYPQRSVYVQRNIPKHGYINLRGKINKPLNKKYFEFWVNGRLLNDEVTIITPTKIFLHGLQSLKNLEIIEINRDPNEYFSDSFLSVEKSDLGRPYERWIYDTYLDDALEGELDGDNYTESEQGYLLSPVWKQVERDHPEFKNFPPNSDIEDDILLRIDNNDDWPEIDNPLYQFMIIDPPTLEGKPILEQSLSFEHFGFKPISDQMIIDMLNDEWKEEIDNDSKFPEFIIVSDDEWYGMAIKMYDEYGVLVNNLNLAAYKVPDTDILRINSRNRISQISRNKITYDLS